MKYYVICNNGATLEGWYETFNTIDEARKYIEENHSICEALIQGQEIDYFLEDGKLKLEFKEVYNEKISN